MNDDIERTDENSKKLSQGADKDKNQQAIVGRDIKNRMEEAIKEPNIEGDPTRSDE
jgi:hypothetical protein